MVRENKDGQGKVRKFYQGQLLDTLMPRDVYRDDTDVPYITRVERPMSDVRIVSIAVHMGIQPVNVGLRFTG